MMIPRERLTYEELVKVAADRHRIHRNHSSSRPLSQDYELIGLLGEEAFAWAFGFDTEYLTLRPGGDGRIDFTLPGGTTIDVKTAEKPYHLLREVEKPHADILVLAGWNPETRTVRLLGWEWDVVMASQPSRHFSREIESHYLKACYLRRMSELRLLIMENEL